VSIKRKLGEILMIGILGAGSILGVPMDPEKIGELLDLMNQPTLEVVVEEEKDKGPK
jgi:hypothetical protein